MHSGPPELIGKFTVSAANPLSNNSSTEPAMALSSCTDRQLRGKPLQCWVTNTATGSLTTPYMTSARNCLRRKKWECQYPTSKSITNKSTTCSTLAALTSKLSKTKCMVPRSARSSPMSRLKSFCNLARSSGRTVPRSIMIILRDPIPSSRSNGGSQNRGPF